MAQKLKPLQDIFPSRRPRILFVGTSPGEKSALTRHYYAGGSNVFWKLLRQSGLTKKLLTPKQDKQLTYYGYGLTDIIKVPTKNQSYLKEKYLLKDVLKLQRRLRLHKPKIAAFIGKKAFRIYIQDGTEKLEYGFQFSYNKHTRIFLLPSTSGQSYRDTKYNEKLKWFKDLKKNCDL